MCICWYSSLVYKFLIFKSMLKIKDWGWPRGITNKATTALAPVVKVSQFKSSLYIHLSFLLKHCEIEDD